MKIEIFIIWKNNRNDSHRRKQEGIKEKMTYVTSILETAIKYWEKTTEIIRKKNQNKVME